MMTEDFYANLHFYDRNLSVGDYNEYSILEISCIIVYYMYSAHFCTFKFSISA